MPPQGIRVSVTSQLPELRQINISNQLAQSSQPWTEFFSFHRIPLDYSKYRIKSSRSLACFEDTIGETANWFQRGVIRVKVVRAQERVPTARRGRTPARGSAGRGRGRTPLDRLPPHLPRQSNGVQHNAPGTSRSTTRRQLFEEDNIQLPGAQDERENSPDYAESIASQDSQPEDDMYSVAKRSFMEMAAKIRNDDFNKWLKEFKAIDNGNPDSKYRWTRKAPLFSNFIFSWSSRHQNSV